MKWQRLAVAMLVAVSLAACSSEKKVGSAIDIEQLEEKNQALGGAALDKKKTTGGFVGDTEKKAQEQAQAQAQAAANQASQNAAAQAQKEKSAVAFVITGSGYDPYVIRVFVGGVITVTNRFTKPASVTADRGEFDSGPIAPGDSWTYEPKTPGKFNFHDEGRPYVVGSLEVIAR